MKRALWFVNKHFQGGDDKKRGDILPQGSHSEKNDDFIATFILVCGVKFEGVKFFKL